jgi:hypothetical protein
VSADKKTIGVSAESQRILDLLADKTLYREQVDSARFAVSLALARGVHPSASSDLTTKWNVGSFDPSGDLRAAIMAYRPDCTEPYRCAEGLLEAGLSMLREHMSIQGQVDLEVILEELSQAASGSKPVDAIQGSAGTANESAG